MNILYDATPLLMRSAGVKNYHHALLRHLIPNSAPHDLRLFPFLPSLTANRNEASNYPWLDTKIRLGAILASNYLALPLAHIAARKVDLFHITPHTWRPPRRVCLTTMIHDPTPALMPECHTPSNVRYFQRFVATTARHLDGILVPSLAVKRDLVQHLPFTDSQIIVVPHGIDEDFFDATPAAIELARRSHHLPPNYILTVGSLEPRKNLTTLIEAFHKLPQRLQQQYPLVITGPQGWKNKELRKLIANSPYVHLTGYVRRRLLPAVYHAASLFVFPSLYEGFGLPLLEAMAARLAVVASNCSAIPEVVGDAGFLVDPRDAEKMALTIEHLLLHPDEAATLGEAAHRQARQFSWQITAAATKAFFEKTYGRAGA
ncbi:MAG: glycosyltransferase family 1 protein [Bryobacterales bacterium]